MRQIRTPIAVFVYTVLAAWLRSASAAVLYVNGNGTNASPPFSTWASAASTIQAAVDVAMSGDEIVVTNGVYQTGGRIVHGALTNRVAVTKPLFLRSVNGPEVTVIRGRQVPGTTNGDRAVRCAYLTNGAILTGFTLTSGATLTTESVDGIGGGVLCDGFSRAILSNCVITGNSAFYEGGGVRDGVLNNCIISSNTAAAGGGAAGFTLPPGTGPSSGEPVGPRLSGMTLNNCLLIGNSACWTGGGAYGALLNDCLVTGNSASDGGGAFASVLNNCVLTGNSAGGGGGAHGSTLNNCTLFGNSATLGGGAFEGTLNNCIAYYNTAFGGQNYLPDIVMNFSCTTPLPLNGRGNITHAPLFIDATNGNLRLQFESPCINAGRNAYVSAGRDLDGNTRIVGGTVDMGAYEFQSPQSIISYAWRQQHFSGLPPFGLGDFDDADSDGQNNWQEWRAGTDPRNVASALRLLTPFVRTNGLVIHWQSVSGQAYSLERGTDLNTQSFGPLASNIAGQAGTTAYTDANAGIGGQFFYRVRVEE